MKITEQQIREDLYQAYFDARKSKRNTPVQLNFEIFMEHQLEDLCMELIGRRYLPMPAYCFIVFDPVQREIYASQFRDRVVQHMLYNYLEPLFERLFIYDTYSCRKEKGTLFGIERYRHHLRSVTDNFKKEAWVLYLDLSGYFMSIDKQLVIDTVLREIHKHFNRKSTDGRTWNKRIDIDFVEYIIHCLLDKNPSVDCIRLGSVKDWDGLPKRKCLAYSPEGKGVVIGDITSQLFSNILLNIFDQWVKRTLKIKHYGHYVDDMFLMHNDKEVLNRMIPLIENYLENVIKVKVNHNKWRLLSARNANQYLGAYIRPYYTVPRQRTINKFCRTMQELEYSLIFNNPTTKDLIDIRTKINSYCGLLSHFKSYKLRLEYLDRPAFRLYFNFSENYSKSILKRQFIV